jgi:8-oxo-dGTP pyrophosphatase MutT (NUDIX family)
LSWRIYTVKVRVAAIVIRDGRLLLVKHRRRGLSYWAFPGGAVQEFETLLDALAREMREEAGFEIQPGRLVYIVETFNPRGRGTHTLNLFYLADVVGEAEATAEGHGEHLDVAEFVPLDQLGGIDLYPEIAGVVKQSVENGFPIEVRYLGNLWSSYKE